MKQKQTKLPKSVKEAVSTILSGMGEKDKKNIRNMKKEDLIMFHFGWGTGIRNSFGLWMGNEALLKDTKAHHPDDASMVIIEAVWEELHKRKNKERFYTKEELEKMHPSGHLKGRRFKVVDPADKKSSKKSG